MRDEIKEISDQYDQEMAGYEMRERYLKASLSALQMFMKDFEKSKESPKEGLVLNSDKEGAEDDGQIY